MDYEKLTRQAYRSPERAVAYKSYHNTRISWGRITTRLEQRVVRGFLERLHLGGTDTVLDIPCGTGVLGPTLARFASRVVGSDISLEMMGLAVEEYDQASVDGWVQADITATPFRSDRFTVTVVLGLMHRIPADVRASALAELYRISSSSVIVSFSATSAVQKVKRSFLRALTKRYIPAASAIPLRQAEAEIRSAGFRIVKRTALAPFLSAESLFLLQKSPLK